MTKKRSTKSALLMSVFALFLCFTVFVGTTFAWFTDSVASANNIIKSGTLDVTMEWFDGKEAVPAADSTDWIDASTGAIFESELWEPGYTEVRHIKIANEGSLALKYQISIIANGNSEDLADVIDVYYVDPAVQVADRDDLDDANKIGTLAEVLANVATTAGGNLKAGENHTVTLALKMQETAGNEYQNKQIGASFSIQLLATQLASEEDSFGPDYDENAGDNSVEVATGVAIQAAIDAGETSITLTDDITVDTAIVIDSDSAVTVNLNGKKVTSTAQKAFEIYSDATIKNGSIEAVQRCVDTRKAVELVLTDVTLVADKSSAAYGNPQAITIGGSENGTKVTMNGVSASSKVGYAIITFVETDLTATGCSISGYGALYVKPGAANSTINFVDCDLAGSTEFNDAEGNSFTTIAVRGNNSTVTIDADSTVSATGEYCYAIGLAAANFPGETEVSGVTITVDGTIIGKATPSTIDLVNNRVIIK